MPAGLLIEPEPDYKPWNRNCKSRPQGFFLHSHPVATKTSVSFVSGCRFLPLLLVLCIQILCLWKNGCIKLPAFATGNRVLACLGCKELFFLATIFHQILQSGCKHSLIQSVLCIPNHGYCLKWMQVCFCEVFFCMSHPLPPGLFISCVLPVCCHAHGGRGAAIKPLRPTPRTCAWIANTQATHRLMTSPGE